MCLDFVLYIYILRKPGSLIVEKIEIVGKVLQLQSVDEHVYPIIVIKSINQYILSQVHL